MDADHISFAIFVSVLAVCGITGNILIIAVYFVKKDSFAIRIRKYILTLSVVDLIINVLIIPYTIMFEFQMVTIDVICHGMEIIRHASIGFSNLILILIAGERLLVVWKLVNNNVSPKMKTVFIVCMLVIATISSVPAALIFEVAPHKQHDSIESGIYNTGIRNQSTEKYCRYISSTLGEYGSGIYRDFLSSMITAELLLLVVFYVIIYVILYCNRKRREENRQNPRENSTPYQSDITLMNNIRGATALQLSADNEAELTTLRNSMLICAGERQENIRQNPKEDNRNADIIPMNNIGGGATAPQSSPDNEAESTIHDSSATSQGDVVDPNQACRNRAKRTKKKTSYVPTKTWTMMFVCTFIYLICWVPFFFAIFNVYDILVFRYFFFLGHATNPIVYSFLNDKVKKGIKEILTKTFITCFRK